MLFALLALAVQAPSHPIYAAAVTRWRLESHPEGCLATGFAPGGASVSLIFANRPRGGPAAPDSETPLAAIDGQVLPMSAALRAIVAYDGRNWREESEADQAALLAALPHARRLDLRRPDGRVLVSVPIASVDRRAQAIARCVAQAHQ